MTSNSELVSELDLQYKVVCDGFAHIITLVNVNSLFEFAWIFGQWWKLLAFSSLCPVGSAVNTVKIFWSIT